MDRASLRSVENLPGAPEILRRLPEQAAAIGRRGRDVVQEEYAWPVLIKRFLPHLVEY